MDKKKVVIAMSGGVDSSVAAALLLEQGFDVIGITMKIWSDSVEDKIDEGGCCSLSAVDDARRVANQLGIPYYVMNFEDVFEKKVIDYFVEEYKCGRTPNPCIACNRFVKFEALLQKAAALGADYLSTGHYAKIEYNKRTHRYLLKKSAAESKDQTYALYNLNQEQLKCVLMPLGDFNNKEEIRRIAEKLGLYVANKPDSQEICFVSDNDYASFIKQRTGQTSERGNFVDKRGNILGQHDGIINYTIGQRKGLGIAFGKPMFVVGIDAKNNRVILGEKGDEFAESLVATDLNFIPFEKLEKQMNVTAKIRYSAKEADAIISPYEDGKVYVKFKSPQRAITPGQAVVFYDGDVVVGGGIIE